jgi:hypothetical protein
VQSPMPCEHATPGSWVRWPGRTDAVPCRLLPGQSSGSPTEAVALPLLLASLTSPAVTPQTSQCATLFIPAGAVPLLYEDRKYVHRFREARSDVVPPPPPCSVRVRVSFFSLFVRYRVVLLCGLVAERQYNSPSSSLKTRQTAAKREYNLCVVWWCLRPYGCDFSIVCAPLFPNGVIRGLSAKLWGFGWFSFSCCVVLWSSG